MHNYSRQLNEFLLNLNENERPFCHPVLLCVRYKRGLTTLLSPSDMEKKKKEESKKKQRALTSISTSCRL